jgi:BioD-like phosphotransacetylase family protein
VALIYVTSANPGEGKTGVAAAIARTLAYSGTPVRLVRLAEDGGHAEADAAWFGSLDFAPGSDSAPVSTAPADSPGTTLVVEGPLASTPAGAKVVVVSRGSKAGSTPEGTVANVVTVGGGHDPVSNQGGTPVVIQLGDDRTLSGFSADEAKVALNAEVLVEGDVAADVTSDHLVIAPIGSDAGQPYFKRFDSLAVVCRFDRTDMHLAAIKAQPNLLILTGGRRPSEYLFDAAGANGIPVLLSRTDTENTVIALEGIFDKTRFHGERKLDRMAVLLAEGGLFEALA